MRGHENVKISLHLDIAHIVPSIPQSFHAARLVYSFRALMRWIEFQAFCAGATAGGSDIFFYGKDCSRSVNLKDLKQCLQNLFLREKEL